MAQSTVFGVVNDSRLSLTILIEPEGHPIKLNYGDEVTVRDEYVKEPVTIKISEDQAMGVVLSLWPGDGDIIVEGPRREVR
jgi:hypothetical protein